ncbi:MAG TPA: hypothetical protein VKR60_07390 [Candidatus Sulfotelmatobacter sp.]|nr:hypothetical protein [Candidatus Sulfotelmatobacter sp.]
MRIRPTFPLVLAVVLVAAAVTVAVQLRKSAPPEPARLLPGADAFLYVNLGWVRKLNPERTLPTVSHDPEYEQFIQQTGFEFERDLEAAAFAAHYPSNWAGGGTGGAAPEPRFSEVFIGKFDGVKLGAYLKQHAQSIENYQSVDIFTIPLEGRSFRVAILGVDSVACSNHDDPAVIRGIVDRSRRLASPFGGPALLRRYYKRVQFASPLWIVAQVRPSAPAFGGWSAVFPKPADIVISTGYNPLRLPLRPSALHLRAEALTASPEDARSVAEKLNAYLTLFHSAEGSVGGPGTDADVKALFDSLQVRQEENRATLSAVIPPGFLKKMLAESPAGVAAPGPQPPAPSGSR